MSHAEPERDKVSSLLARFPGPLSLGASKRNSILLLLGASVVVALGAWMIHQAASPDFQPNESSKLYHLLALVGLHLDAAGYAAIGWAAAVFGGLSAIVGVLTLALGRVGITLDENGFTRTSLLRRKVIIHWSDVDDFVVVPLQRGLMKVEGIGFNYRPAKSSVLARGNRAWFGREEMLPSVYELTAAEMVRLMSLWRERALSKKR